MDLDHCYRKVLRESNILDYMAEEGRKVNGDRIWQEIQHNRDFYNPYSLYTFVNSSCSVCPGTVWYNEKINTVILPICKNGNTSLKDAITLHEDWNTHYAQLTNFNSIENVNTIFAILSDPGVKKVIVLRDPLERYISGMAYFATYQNGWQLHPDSLEKQYDYHFCSQLLALPQNISQRTCNIIDYHIYQRFGRTTDLEETRFVLRNNMSILNHFCFDADHVLETENLEFVYMGDDPLFTNPIKYITEKYLDGMETPHVNKGGPENKDVVVQMLEQPVHPFTKSKTTLKDNVKRFFEPDYEFLQKIDFKNKRDQDEIRI